MAKHKEVGFPLLTYADELVDDLRGHVPGAFKEFDAKAIHQARVATRRLKSMLDLMRLVLSREQRLPFARVLRKLRRRLGPLRDLDVMIGHLTELAQYKVNAVAAGWVERQLQQQRDEARQESLKGDSAVLVLGRIGVWWGLREEVAEAREAIDTLLAESLHLQIDAFAESADRLLLDGQHAGTPRSEPDGPVSKTTQPSERQDPHALRIAGKVVRYTLEMAAVQGHKLPPKLTRSFKKMQEELGLWHDFVVLSERVMQVSLEALLPHHDAAMQGRVLDLARRLLNRSTSHLDRFAKLWRERGQELTASIRQHFPLTRPIIAPEASPVIAPQTDPDPAGLPETPAPEAPPPAVAQGAEG